MYALDTANGRLRWAYATGLSVDSSPAAGGPSTSAATTRTYMRWTPDHKHLGTQIVSSALR